MRGFTAILKKEALHMLRDRGTMRFALLIPSFQLVLFGLIDTNVRHVPLALFDQSRSRESRQLVAELQATSYFDLKEIVPSRDALHAEIVAGHAAVGVEIPPDYARRVLAREPADVLVMIDGSDATQSGQALGAANGLALSKSLHAMVKDSGSPALPFNFHPLILFNPDSRSANLLIPGLVAILLTFSGTLLAAFAIVRERERGTLEQLMVTPVSPVAVVLGKLIPYLGLGFLQLCFVLLLMTQLFRVPVHGNIFLMLGLALVYLFALLSQGLLISAFAKTQMEAMQLAQMFLLPSIMLSGYIFPIPSLPRALQWVSQILPATHFIAISRGIAIRGASFTDLWPDVAALLIISAVLVAVSTRAFKKTIA
jgi:ABC-2 type transport system permease protein